VILRHNKKKIIKKIIANRVESSSFVAESLSKLKKPIELNPKMDEITIMIIREIFRSFPGFSGRGVSGKYLLMIIIFKMQDKQTNRKSIKKRKTSAGVEDFALG